MKVADSWLGSFERLTDTVNSAIWGVPLVASILVAGILLTCVLRFKHLLNIKHAFECMFRRENGASGDVSQFGSLCTSLSATIGNGNIVGVATAIGTGGPGSLFWMEVAAFFGMATKYAEGLLAVKYRKTTPDGTVLGGPFYYIEDGLAGRFGIGSWKWLSVVFAFFGVAAGIMGIGTVTQVHGITSAVQRFFDPQFDPSSAVAGIKVFGSAYSPAAVIAGIAVTLCVALVVIGGLRRISAVATVVVPFMAVFYMVAVALVLAANIEKIPAAIGLIFRSAFDPAAFTGGAVGSLFVAMQKGIARGIFSNEAGLGSAPIAAAAARTNEPVRQGLVCMTGTFIDTIVICSMTGIVIVVTGAWEPSLGLKGVDITIEAFGRGFAFFGSDAFRIANFFLMCSLAFFAFTTILGWDYYSEKCLEYLAGSNRGWAVKLFRAAYVAMVFVGPYLTVSAVWSMADIFNGLMAFPNLVALVLLSPVVWRATKKYFEIGRY